MKPETDSSGEQHTPLLAAGLLIAKKDTRTFI
jgi:hypothetical protein